jgi:hypothetical protein
MNTFDNDSAGRAGQSGQPGRRLDSALEEGVGLPGLLALGVRDEEGPPAYVLRGVNRGLVGPFRRAGLEAKRDRLGPLREKFERDCCGLFRGWFPEAEARADAERPMSNAEKIALLRQAFFADVDELERSGEVVLPD